VLRSEEPVGAPCWGRLIKIVPTFVQGGRLDITSQIAFPALRRALTAAPHSQSCRFHGLSTCSPSLPCDNNQQPHSANLNCVATPRLCCLQLRYANNSNYKNDKLIRKEMYVSPEAGFPTRPIHSSTSAQPSALSSTLSRLGQ